MGKKKLLYYELTRKTLSKSKDEDGNRTPQIMFGVESRLPDHPFLEDWGERYQSIFRTAVNALQNGVTEDQIEKSFQGRFGIEWAWADSIATDANATIKQLQSSKQNCIEALKVDIEIGKKVASETITKMELQLENPTKKNMLGFAKRLMGVESKIHRIHRQETKLNRLLSEQRLHICFGGSKLASSQHHLDENNYDSIDQWREDWLKKRSGNFYSVGKGRVTGNNPVAGIHHIEDDLFKVVLSVPTFLRFVYGKTVELEFSLDGKRKSDILYALEANKPITVSCFRREHKDDQWYIHLSSYIADIPTVTSMRNGCLGIDLNAKTIDVIYIKPDGNPDRAFSGASTRKVSGGSFPRHTSAWRKPPGGSVRQDKGLSFAIPIGTTGQVKSQLRDIVKDIVILASSLNCWIACENLDFTQKKASLRHTGSRDYNRMLSGFIYDGFRSALVVRAEKYGVGVKFVSAVYSSVIGMVKYMSKYGLNSATAAAMTIARRALGFRELIPQQWLKTLPAFFSPEDKKDAGFGSGWRKISKLLRDNQIHRGQHFQPNTVLRLLKDSPQSSRGKKGRKTAVTLVTVLSHTNGREPPVRCAAIS
jgi:IS605 OrfB family transposase